MNKLFDDSSWARKAACAGKDTDWWFSEYGTYPRMPDKMRVAVVTCWNKCPVRETCLKVAIERPERWGIWGGVIAYDRMKGRTITGANELGRLRAEREGLIWDIEEETG